VKAGAILLRFDGQSLSGFMPEAQKLAEPIDPQFLREVSGGDEFGFRRARARILRGARPTPQEAAAVALALHANPMYFYKRGKDATRPRPRRTSRRLGRRREECAARRNMVDAWAADIACEARAPSPSRPMLDTPSSNPKDALDGARSRPRAARLRHHAQRGARECRRARGPRGYFLGASLRVLPRAAPAFA
jgi:exoribonuclease-2